MRNSAPLGPYRGPMSGALRCPHGGGAISCERGTPVGAGVVGNRVQLHAWRPGPPVRGHGSGFGSGLRVQGLDA